MFPKLDRYQQDGYKQLQKIADRYRGAFLCDGVGLGKTFVGLMLIEWLVRYERKRVALFVPKAAATAVWEAALARELPDLGDAYGPGVLIFNHTDLTRDNAKIQKQLDDVAATPTSSSSTRPTTSETPAHAARRRRRARPQQDPAPATSPARASSSRPATAACSTSSRARRFSCSPPRRSTTG